MSITRSQQAKQMLQNGGRIGLQGGGRDMGGVAGASRGPAGGQTRGDFASDRGRNPTAQFRDAASISEQAREALTAQRSRARGEITPSTKFRNRLISGIINSYIPFGGSIYSNMIDQKAMGFSPPKREIVETVRDDDNDDSDQVMAQLFTPYQKDFIEDKAEELSPIELAIQERDQMGGPRLFAAEGGRMGLQEGGGIEQRLEQLGGDVTSAEQMLQGINQRLKTAESSLGSGGGIGGLPGAGGPKIDEAFNPMQTPPGMFPAGPPQGFSSFEEMMKLKTPDLGQPNFYYDLEGVRRDPQGNLFTPKPGELPQTLSRPRPELENVFMGNINPVGGPSDKLIPIDPYARTQLAGLSQDGQRFDSAQSAFDALAEQTRKIREIRPGTRDMVGTEMFQGAEGFKRFTDMFNQINDPNYVAPSLQLASQGSLGIPAAGYADGGNVVGGEFDFESARQAYGLGKLVKKIGRTIKKIGKSPVGKAALAFGAYKLGKTPFGKSDASLFERGASFFGNMEGKDQLALAASGALVAAPFIFGEDDTEDEYQKFLAQRGGQGIDIPGIRAKPYDTLARAFVAEGGKPEPVATKTMPLLDMGGKEMDLREEGGFVPIGRMEKADDVPARLSKNEFVFTADAVRNAGDGNVDKGAEVMYNMMKNLEAGGEVSEESQGLDGARKMFQTSQRLEEVL